MDDPTASDEVNILRSWSFEEFAPSCKQYILNLRESTGAHQRRAARIIICSKIYRQSLLALTCVYPGVSTLIVNLVHQSTLLNSRIEPWQEQYADGSSNQIYVLKLNPIFEKRSFAEVSWILYRDLEITVFGIQKEVKIDSNQSSQEEVEVHAILNPSHSYRLQSTDSLLVIARNWDAFRDYHRYERRSDGKKAYELEIMSSDNMLATVALNRAHMLSENVYLPVMQPPRNRLHRTNSFVGGPLEEAVIISAPDNPLSDEPLPFCHVCTVPAVKEHARLVTAEDMTGHILVVTGDFDLFIFMVGLRTATLSENELKVVVMLCHREPSKEEWDALSIFPKLFFMMGSYRNSRDMRRAGVATASRVVLLQTATGQSRDDDDLVDASAIMASHQIQLITKGEKFVLTELSNRKNMRFLKPLVKKAAGEWSSGAEYIQSPAYAAGRVLAASMLDSILFQSYHTPIIPVVVKLLLGLHGNRELELDDFLSVVQSDLTMRRVNEHYVGKPYSELYEELVMDFGAIPIGLYRTGTDINLGNPLPFVYTNPRSSTILDRDDFVYVLFPKMEGNNMYQY